MKAPIHPGAFFRFMGAYVGAFVGVGNKCLSLLHFCHREHITGHEMVGLLSPDTSEIVPLAFGALARRAR